MNPLALVSRGYLCSCGASLVAGVHPENTGASELPHVIVEEVSSPHTIVKTVHDLRPVTRPKKRKK